MSETVKPQAVIVWDNAEQETNFKLGLEIGKAMVAAVPAGAPLQAVVCAAAIGLEILMSSAAESGCDPRDFMSDFMDVLEVMATTRGAVGRGGRELSVTNREALKAADEAAGATRQ